MTRSPYLRDRVADMPQFRDRETPLPMAPKAKISRATADLLLPRVAPNPDRRGLPLIFAALPPLGSIGYEIDDSIPDGVIEIDGTQVRADDMIAAVEGP